MSFSIRSYGEFYNYQIILRSAALKRLGGGKPVPSSQRWKQKKEGTSTADSASNKEDLLKLTGFADRLLQKGNFEIYQYTFEKLNFEIKEREEKRKEKTTVIPEGTSADDALDMFAADMDVKEKGDGEKVKETKAEGKAEQEESAKASGECTNVVV